MSDMPVSEFTQFQKAYSRFKERCQEQDVWDRASDHVRIAKAAGMKDWAAKKEVMAVWEGCLSSLESDGTRRSDWDFDRMKPKSSRERGAFENHKIEVTRKLTIYEMILESQQREKFEENAGKTKEGPIESSGGIMIGSIKLKLKSPNSTMTREQQIKWVEENFFEYSKFRDAKDYEGMVRVLEQAPTFSACSWMEYAANNPTQFMRELPKLVPQEKSQSDVEKASEVFLNQVLDDIEQTTIIVCPSCSSKF